jgi:peptide-methionine (R)-S-oxide reductase
MTRAHLLTALASAATYASVAPREAKAGGTPHHFEVNHTDEEWRKLLTPEQYTVLRKHGTEAAGSSPALGLFSSETKYHSGTGWPSFHEPLPNAVETSKDDDLIVPRVEVHCKRCGGHLGHVFDDGPKPTGLRYCMNGVALQFQEHKEQ